MRRREVLAGAVGIGSAAVGGCGLLSCGPGEVAIEALTGPDGDVVERSLVGVRGTVTAVGTDGAFLRLDDTTGIAMVVPPFGYGYEDQSVIRGDCFETEGYPRPPEEPDVDVRIRESRSVVE